MSYGNKGGGYQKRSGGGSSYGSKKPYSGGGDRERKPMHDATCATCGNDCKVPFRPTGDRPIHCSKCFEKKGGKESYGAERRFESRDRKPSFDRSAPMTQGRPDPQIAELKGELRTMHSKLDRLMQMLGDKKVVPEELSFDKKSVSPIKMAALKKKAKKGKKVAVVADEVVTEKPAKKVAKKATKKVVTEDISFVDEVEAPKKVVKKVTKKAVAKKVVKKATKKVAKKATKKVAAKKK